MSRIRPESRWADGRLTWIHLFAPPRHRDPKKALQLAEKVFRMHASNHGYASVFGIAYYRLGRLDEAIETLEQAAALHQGPGSYDQFALAMCYHRTGQVEKARACYDKGIQWWCRSIALYPQLQVVRDEAKEVLAGPPGSARKP